MSAWLQSAAKALKSSLPKPMYLALRETYRRSRSWWRSKKRTEMQTLRAQDLAYDLKKLGIQPGDVVMVHSALSKLGNVEGGPRAVVQALIQAVGNDGTLLMPSYSSADEVFAGQVVDLRTSRSLNGAVTEEFRKTPGVLRSSHPFSSVCAWGKHAKWLTEGHALDDRICHKDSPIGRLVELGGKVLGIGVTLGPISFYHVLEDTWDGFPLQVYSDPIPVRYVDADGKSVERPVRRYRPELSKTRIDMPESAWLRSEMARYLSTQGAWKSGQVGMAQSWWIQAPRFYDELKTLAFNGVTIYLTEAEWRARGGSAEGFTSLAKSH